MSLPLITFHSHKYTVLESPGPSCLQRGSHARLGQVLIACFSSTKIWIFMQVGGHLFNEAIAIATGEPKQKTKGTVKQKKNGVKRIPNPRPSTLESQSLLLNHHCQLLLPFVFYFINATIVANHKGVLYY